MQVSVEVTSDLGRKLMLEIPAEEIDSEVAKRVIDTAKRARIDGFRPGKVPRKVIKQRFGDALRAEVISEVANQQIQNAVSQESLRPVGQPQVDVVKNEEGQNLELVATFEIYPEIELADVTALKIEKLVASVEESDIDSMIQKLREQRATWKDVERAAKDGDQVNIDFVGTKDGVEFDGGSAKGTDLELGSGQMIDGFEAGLVGAAAGDERKLDLTFPEDYQNKELAGAKAQFAITVNAVREKELPELDDEFVASLEVEGGVAQFRDKVRENMETQLKDGIENVVKQQVMDGLLEANTFEIPAALVQGEIGTLREQTLERFGGAGQGFDPSLLPDEMFHEQAHRRVALSIIVNRAVQQYEIQPTREQLIEFIDDIAESYDDPDEVRALYMSDESRMQQVGLVVTERLIVEKITELAQVDEKTSTYDDVMQALSGQ